MPRNHLFKQRALIGPLKDNGTVIVLQVREGLLVARAPTIDVLTD